MRRISRSALVPYSTDEMFALVDDVERYPEFVPWCSNAIVHHRDSNTVEGTVELSRGRIRQSFRTRNAYEPGVFMTLALVDGPFRHLDGRWSFSPLGESGCKVELDIEFELAGKSLDLLFGRIFEETCNRLVGAFTGRAHDMYGGGGN